jgi:nitronate monooxygenase
LASTSPIGSPFLASSEANTQDEFKRMIVESSSRDVLVTRSFTGVDASFLRPSIVANGLDPTNLVRAEGAAISIADGGADPKAWRDIWSVGQGIGAVKSSGPAGEYIDALAAAYARAREAMGMPALSAP